MEFKTAMKERIEKLNVFLEDYIDSLNVAEDGLKDALKYTLLAPCKRLRGLLMLCFYEFFGGQGEAVYNFAAAIEMVQAYSLIHDDLPCMDNSSERRGRVSSHLKFGEDIALLAGDALLTNAFEIASKEEVLKLENTIRCINILSRQAGAEGMIRGQYIDLKVKTKNFEKEKLFNLYRLKTGALFLAACEIGALLAGADEESLKSVKEYASKFGMSFQMIDDVLDEDFMLSDLIDGISVKDTIFKFLNECRNSVRKLKGDGFMLEGLVDFIQEKLHCEN